MKLQRPDNADATELARTSARLDIKAVARTVAIVPAIVIPVIGIAVVGVIAFILSTAVSNNGLMPRRTALESYACKGFAVPFQIGFRHGLDLVQLRYGSVALSGELLNGKIAWKGFDTVAAQLGFVPPTEIVYDDTRIIRMIDARDAMRVERTCERFGEEVLKS